ARLRIDRAMLTKLAWYGIPVSLTVAMIVVISSSDRFLLGLLMGKDAAGLYSAAVDLTGQSISLLLLVIHMSMFPMAVHAWEREGAQAAQATMRMNGALQFGIGVPCVAGFAMLTPGIVNSVLGESFRQAA